MLFMDFLSSYKLGLLFTSTTVSALVNKSCVSVSVYSNDACNIIRYCLLFLILFEF
jgi:hypothetical protein